jgi:hypothetical protein
MCEQNQTPTESDWKRLIKKHKVAFSAFAAGAILAAAFAVYVFVWLTANVQSAGLVPSTLNLWSMADVVTFLLNAIFWELIAVGIPLAIGAVGVWQWWKMLPDQEKSQYHLSGKPSKKNGTGAISPLLFIAFALKVYVDGNWHVAISSWTLDYVVGSMVTILMWATAIFAVPAVIGFAWWISHKTEKTQ